MVSFQQWRVVWFSVGILTKPWVFPFFWDFLLHRASPERLLTSSCCVHISPAQLPFCSGPSLLIYGAICLQVLFSRVSPWACLLSRDQSGKERCIIDFHFAASWALISVVCTLKARRLVWPKFRSASLQWSNSRVLAFPCPCGLVLIPMRTPWARSRPFLQ